MSVLAKITCTLLGHEWPAQLIAFPAYAECRTCKTPSACDLCTRPGEARPPTLPILKAERCSRCGAWRRRTIA